MNLESRSGRVVNEQFLRLAVGDTTTASLPRPPSPTAPFYSHRASHEHSIRPTRDCSISEGVPPSKKRKLSLRTKARDNRQTTLDQHLTRPDQSQPLRLAPKPAIKFTVTQPHGQLLDGINETRRPLEVSGVAVAGPTARESATSFAQRAGTRSAAHKKKEEKRTLRSQDDGPRIKSELATYFSNYEDVMFDVPKELESITPDSAFYLVDDTATLFEQHASPPKEDRAADLPPKNGHVNKPIQSPITPQRSNPSHFNTSPSASLDMIARTLPDLPEDPLDDAHFFKSHRRAERKEKQLRNIERERAMHEKVQLERILDGLLGHDWLKVLGVTGVTDGEAKKFEGKREFYIQEVKGLVDKFKLWKELEKKQRLEKYMRGAEESDHETEGSVEPPSSDLNASASRQLQQETIHAAARTSPKIKLNFSRHQNTTSSPSTPTNAMSQPLRPRNEVPIIALSPQEPITSFYSKRHLRDAALGKARHGRNVTAFGHLIPDMVERDFKLPLEYITENTLKANARERRRRNRASTIDASSAP
nr:hypothetical protein CFP56_52136 [Quercus suber]